MNSGDLAEAKSRIEEIVAEVVSTGEPWVIGSATEPMAVILDWDTYQAMMAEAGRCSL